MGSLKLGFSDRIYFKEQVVRFPVIVSVWRWEWLSPGSHYSGLQSEQSSDRLLDKAAVN